MRGLLLCLFLLAFPVRADIVFPAQLRLTETSPGTYEVLFILPVINGKILKAQPVLPEFCTASTQPRVQVDAYQKKTQWEIQCDTLSLHGQQFGVEGLLGSPIDIILEIKTLEGRHYRTTLSPNASYFQIPPPPGFSDFLTHGTFFGLRNLLLQWGLGLMFLGYFLRVPGGRFGKLLGIAILGVSLGHFLSSQELLLVPSWAGAISSLLVSLLLLLPRGLGLKNRGSGHPELALLGLGALLIGGGFPTPEIRSGYTGGEWALLNGFTVVGISLGVILLGLLVRQFLTVLSLYQKNFEVPLARLFAGLSLGMLLWKSSLFWNFPSMLPAIPLALLGFTMALATWAAFLPGRRNGGTAAWVVPVVLLGYLFGVWGILVPYQAAFLLATSAVLLIDIRFGRALNAVVLKGLLGIAGLTAGNLLFAYANDTLSYPHARSFFFGILLALIAFLIVAATSWIQSANARKRYFSLSSSFLLLFFLLLGIQLFKEDFPTTMGISINEGKIPVPYLSLVFLLAGMVLWPRQRKIHRHLGIQRKAPVVSLSLVAAALFLLPVQAEVQNPWYRLDLMDEESLQGLIERRLWSTYTAFNIADEDALFEQLAENLDEDLLDHIYLDSRRRLTMGLREGSQVTVKEVNLAPLNPPESRSTGAAGLKYPATWTVTAQVKHLKHIHYRKNQYTGTIALKPMDSGWKISEIILTSEDRKVIASGSL